MVRTVASNICKLVAMLTEPTFQPLSLISVKALI